MATSSQVDAAVRILLEAKDNASPEINKVSGSLSKLDDKAKNTGSTVSALLGGSFAALTGILADSARAAAEEEVGIVRLSTAVKNAGLSYEDLGDTIEQKIAAQTKLTAYSDDVQRDSLAQLVVRTKDANKAFQLMSVAMDLARAKNIDLATATMIVGKVYDGNTGILAKYGIKVKEGASATEAFEALQEQTAGQAVARGATLQGTLDKQKIAIDNMKESLGGMLGAMQGPVAMLPGLSKGFIGLGAAVGFFRGTNEGANISIVKSFVMAKLVAIQNAVRAAYVATTGAIRAFNITMLLNPVGLIIAGLVALGAVLFILYQKVEPVRNAINGLWQGFLKMLGPIGELIKLVGGAAGDAFGGLAKTIGLAGDETVDATKDMNKFGDAAVADAKKAQSAFERMYTALKDQFKPGGTDETANFLKSIGYDEKEIDRVLDALYDTVGGNEKSRFEKMTDEAYARLTGTARQTILAPIEETLKKYADMSEEEFAKVAKAAGKAPIEFMAAAKKEEADAQARLKLYSDDLAAAIAKARENARGFTAIVEPHVQHVHDLRDAWQEARDKVNEYGVAISNIPLPPSHGATGSWGTGGATGSWGSGWTGSDGTPYEGYATGGFVRKTGLALVHKDEYVVPRDKTASMGNTTIAPSITLNYTGNGQADASVAAQMTADVLDQITEAMRQQSRRVGTRLSPFAGA